MNRGRYITLSLGERVSCDGAFISRGGTGEGSPEKIVALSLGERVSCDGVFISRGGTGEAFLLFLDVRTNSNGKWQTAKFKRFAIWDLPNRNSIAARILPRPFNSIWL
jgi:hypothetical protein